MTTSRSHKPTKTESLLVNLAESIGSTLGTLAAKADAAQRAITHSDIASTIERGGKTLVRKTKRAANSAAKVVSSGRSATKRTARRVSRKVSTRKAAAKRSAARKAKTARSRVNRTARRAKVAIKRVARRNK